MSEIRENLLWYPDDAVTEMQAVSWRLGEMERYDDILCNLNNMCSYDMNMYNAEIHFFGSRTFGLGRLESDLDIFIDCEDDYWSDKNNKIDSSRLRKIINELDDDWEVRSFIPHASVPLLKVNYLPLNLNCDIVVSNGLGCENSELLDHLLNIQPQARFFFHFVRSWVNSYGLGFRSYPLLLLVIFFLQSKNLMPSIERVQRNFEPEYIDGWNVSYDATRDITSYGTKKLRNYKSCLVDFFDFYSYYSFDQYVMSTYAGQSVLKRDYAFEFFKLDKAMCLAGPIKRSYNCTYDVGIKRVQKFRAICRDAVEELSQANDF